MRPLPARTAGDGEARRGGESLLAVLSGVTLRVSKGLITLAGVGGDVHVQALLLQSRYQLVLVLSVLHHKECPHVTYGTHNGC